MEQNVLNSLIENEKSLSLLYFGYSEKFQNNLWDILARDEQAHAELLKLIIYTDKLSLPPEIDGEIISSLGSRIEKDIFSIDETTENQAYERAMSYEKSILERKIFDLLYQNSTNKKILDRIKIETEEHYKLLENSLRKDFCGKKGKSKDY